jgi:hypothetical protein
MQSFAEARQVRLYVNDIEIGDGWTVMPTALGEFSALLPADVVGDGRNLRLRFAYDAGVVPAEAGQGSDMRRLSVAVERIALRIEP